MDFHHRLTACPSLKYTNAAYYKGGLVDAVATIKVTPMKNRTPGANWGNENYGNIKYYPIIQISDVLYRGWNWQNVDEINVDLQLIDKNSGQPIDFNAGAFGDFSATYYTINSLNEASIQGDGEYPAAAYGPEYVFPKADTVSNVYVIPSSHIKTSYNGGPGVQYAYNGGSDYWDGDDPSHPNWSQNSVLFTTSNTNHLNFTMGNLARHPQDQRVPRTNFVWTSISTQSFTNYYVEYIDIPVEKKWSDGQYNDHGDDAIDVELYYEYYKNGQRFEKKVSKKTLNKSANWKGTFFQQPNIESLRKLIAKQQNVSQWAITGVKYFILIKDTEGEPRCLSDWCTIKSHNLSFI